MFIQTRWLRIWRSGWRERRGSITVMAAAMFPVLIGISGLGVEYGYGLLTRVENQRVADLAAYSGALAYNATNLTASMNSAVSRIVVLNGVAGSAAVATLVASPSGDGHQAVEVTVTTNVPLVLASLLGAGSALAVAASAYAELNPNAGACIIALQTGGNGVILKGGTSVSAPLCSVASNSTSSSAAGVQVPCGTTLTTNTLIYDTSAVPSQPCLGIKNATGGTTTLTKALTPDPLATNSSVTAATTHLTSVKSMTSPTVTVPTGTSLSIPNYQAANSPLPMPAGCTLTGYTSGPWTVTCVGAGPFNFGSLVVAGGVAATFVNSTVGTYNFSGGITTGGGSTTTFAAGIYNIGITSNGCGGNYSICHTGPTMTFGGPSTFVLANGIYAAGNSVLSLGAGASNSYKIGSDSGNGYAINAGGSSIISFAAVSGTNNAFQLVGLVNTAGGSCITLPAAAAHDINGSFAIGGGVILGAGVYTVNGYVALGTSGGGDSPCGGTSVGMNGTGVSLVISGSTAPTSGPCGPSSGPPSVPASAFCVAAGYNHVTLTAPTTGTMTNLLVIGPTNSANNTGAAFTEGASNTTLSGVFYFPYGAVTLGGGASVGSGSGQCLELIGSQVNLTGGTALATTCSGLAGATAGGQIVLVQ